MAGKELRLSLVWLHFPARTAAHWLIKSGFR